jgi:succinyl-CoA synthetase beta subunit
MNLHEYQSKRIFAQYGIPTPDGDVATTPADAMRIAERIAGPVAVKAQVLTGGRGKAGGIRLAQTSAEAGEAAAAILGMTIRGLQVRRVLVERAADKAQELYLALALDRTRRRLVLMGCAEGGVDIEEVAARSPAKIVSVVSNPLIGLQPFQAREVGCGIEIGRNLLGAFMTVCDGLYRALLHSDALLAEINPLILTRQGTLLAADAKMVVDDNALFRHADLERGRDVEDESPAEREARKYDLSYVRLDGAVGCLVNGAGLAMATMDMTKFYGGAPANFLDIGGGARAERVAAALRIILAEPNVRSVLINIFGGITRCDEVARGVLEALRLTPTRLPIVVRLVGTNEDEGRALLASAQVITATTLADAARLAVAAAGAN